MVVVGGSVAMQVKDTYMMDSLVWVRLDQATRASAFPQTLTFMLRWQTSHQVKRNPSKTAELLSIPGGASSHHALVISQENS